MDALIFHKYTDLAKHVGKGINLVRFFDEVACLYKHIKHVTQCKCLDLYPVMQGTCCLLSSSLQGCK